MKNMSKIDTIKTFWLSGSFKMFASIVLLITTSMIFIFVYVSYSSFIHTKYDQLKSISKRADYVLADTFDKAGRLMTYIGRNINANNYQDFEYINSLLKKTAGREYKSSDLLSWSMFDWVDNTNHLRVNRMKGVFSKPEDMSIRDHTRKCRLNPWTLQFSKAAIGIPSGTFVIPAGVGITDDSDEYLGLLAVGFSVHELTDVLLDKIKGEKISIILLDEQHNVVLNTEKPDFYHVESDQHVFHEEELIGTTAYSGLLDPKPKRENITYSYYKKMKDFPYTLLLGLDYSACIKEFLLLIFPSIIQILSMGILSIALIYISRKRIIDIGRNASKAKDDLAAHVNKRVQIHLDSILHYSEILMRHYRGEIRIGMDEKRQLEFACNIYKAASIAKNIDNDASDKTIVDLNLVLNAAIDMHSMTILQRNIALSKKIHDCALNIHGDQLFMKQIVSGLLAHAINYAPLGSDVFITNYAEKEYAILEIIYSSFDLDAHDIMRIQRDTSYGNELANLYYAIKLVEIHGGTINIRSKGAVKIITVIFPVAQEEHIELVDNIA